MWMQCYTQEEIAEKIGLSVQPIKDSISDNLEKLQKNPKFLFNDDSFSPPIYNIWKLQNKSSKVSHFGNSEQQWLENLIYLYTEPFDIIVDPFAGGGSTIDVCKKRGRRYYVSDRKPIIEREHEIRLHDIMNQSKSKTRGRAFRSIE